MKPQELHKRKIQLTFSEGLGRLSSSLVLLRILVSFGLHSTSNDWLMVGFGSPGIMGLFSEQHVVSHRCKVIPLK